jgi:hypothetical protein
LKLQKSPHPDVSNDDGALRPAWETYDRDVEAAAYRLAVQQGDNEQEKAELARAIKRSSAKMTAYIIAQASRDSDSDVPTPLR